MVEFKPMGDSGILALFEQKISPEISEEIRRFASALRGGGNEAVVEVIPSYAAVCIVYNPAKASYGEMEAFCKKILGGKGEAAAQKAQVFEIPVLYNEEYGPDLEFVASHNSLTTDEVIKIHTSKPYLIYMLGFAPGFCYLGGMDERIAAPRKQVPRQKIAAGSVGIAGSQTGMYPIVSPGGWQLIGLTPLKLYDPYRTPSVHYNSGDYIQYVSIDEAEFKRIKALEEKGEYKWISKPYEGGDMLG